MFRRRPPYAHGQASALAHARARAHSVSGKPTLDVRGTGGGWGGPTRRNYLESAEKLNEQRAGRWQYVTALGALVHLCTGTFGQSAKVATGITGEDANFPTIIIPYFKKIFFWIVSNGAAASDRHKQMQIVFCLFAIIWLNSHIVVLDVCQRKLSCYNIQVGPGQTSTGWWLH